MAFIEENPFKEDDYIAVANATGPAPLNPISCADQKQNQKEPPASYAGVYALKTKSAAENRIEPHEILTNSDGETDNERRISRNTTHKLQSVDEFIQPVHVIPLPSKVHTESIEKSFDESDLKARLVGLIDFM